MEGLATGRAPRWAAPAILGLAGLQAAAALLSVLAPPSGTAASGLHIPDSAIFLQSMRMFTEGFATPYATCGSAWGPASPRYFAAPHLWLYGALGWFQARAGGSPLLWYGLLNGACFALFLWMVWRALAAWVPRLATRAFLLFALSTGPGGALYLAACAAGWHAHPAFETYFFRFAAYDLFEGAHLHPMLYAPRAYYTLSLALCLGGMLAWTRHAGGASAAAGLAWLPLLGLGAFLNARFGVFFLGWMALYALAGPDAGTARRRAALGFAAGVLPGIAASALLMSLNPATVANHQDAGAMAMWWSPFLAAAGIHLLLAAPGIFQAMRAAAPWTALALGAALGYVALYGLFCWGHEAYHGNLATGRNAGVAAAVSDLALLGAPLGAGVAWLVRRRQGFAAPGAFAMPPWLALAFLATLALALSGWGGGWFLRFGPQRAQVLLWLPLCVAAAAGIAGLPRRMRGPVQFGVLAMGLVGIAVAVLYFQTPFGRSDNRGPFPGQHVSVMPSDDAALIARLPEGRTLAPAPAGDWIALRTRQPVVFGLGSFNLTDQPHAVLAADAGAFFASGTACAERESIARRWCAAWVYVPALPEVSGAARAAIAGAPWLALADAEGNAAVYSVLPPEE